MTRATRYKDQALDAFIAAKAEIDAMLARLAALSEDQFNAERDSVNWADVGTLNHYWARLHEITDMAFNEGGHSHGPTGPARTAGLGS